MEETQVLKNGTTIDSFKLPNGILYRSVRKGGLPVFQLPVDNRSSFIASNQEGSNTLYENFDGWDGIEASWIPEGWSVINSTEEMATLKDGAFSWHVAEAGTTFPEPLDGKYLMEIYHASYTDDGGAKVELAQDEWLITPEFIPQENDFLYFNLSYNPLFLFNVSNQYLDFSNPDEMSFKEKVQATTLKIKLKEENGSWIELKDIYDDWKDDYGFQDLLDNYSYQSFHYYQFALGEYAGKKIKIAFQFVGYQGNAMALDAVTVGLPPVEAAYSRPGGAFFCGFSKDFNRYDGDRKNLLLIPPFTDIIWENSSSPSAQSFEWVYSDPEDAESVLTSEDRELITNYPASIEAGELYYRLPELSAFVTDEHNDTYQWNGNSSALKPGGRMLFEGSGTQQVFGVGNYDLNNGYAVATTGDNDLPAFGYYDGVDDFWTSIFGGSVPIHVLGLANYFEKPVRPYVLSGVWCHGIGEVSDEAQFMLVLYKAANGSMQPSYYAVAVCEGKDAVKVDMDGKTYLTFPFVFEEDVVVDGEMFAMLTGFDQKDTVTKFGILQTQNYDSFQGYGAQFIFSINGQGSYMYPVTAVGMYSSFLFSLDAVYPWMECGEDEYEFNMEGGEKTFDINSFYEAEKWTVSVVSATGEAVEWLQCEKEGRQLILTASTWEENQDAIRSCEVKISAPGCEKILQISQNGNASGIEYMKQEPTTQVAIVDGNLHIIYNKESGSGRLYDMAGKLLKEFKLGKGKNVIGAEVLTSGSYILQTNDGEVFKVLK